MERQVGISVHDAGPSIDGACHDRFDRVRLREPDRKEPNCCELLRHYLNPKNGLQAGIHFLDQWINLLFLRWSSSIFMALAIENRRVSAVDSTEEVVYLHHHAQKYT